MYGVHPNQVTLWKKQLIDNATSAFDKDVKDKDLEESEKKQDELYSQVGASRLT